MESLTKYVPFVDLLLKIDREKYYKFLNIRKWILSKKNYPQSDINKIEQAILTQYNNLLVEKNVQIPQNIRDIFTLMIDLCSDDEENNNIPTRNETEKNTSETNKRLNRKENGVKIMSENYDKRKRQSKTKRKKPKPKIEDNDLEIISIDCNVTKPVAKEVLDMDKISKDIFNKIDQLTEDEMKMKSLIPEPINYTYKLEVEQKNPEGNEEIYQRRSIEEDILFKRRADFKNDEILVENLVDPKKHPLSFASKPIEIIPLDSDSDSEIIKDDERPSTSNLSTLNKFNIEKRTEKNLEKCENEIENTDSNSNGSNSTYKKVEHLCNSIEAVLPEMSDILNELKDVNNDSTLNMSDKQIEETESDKENNSEKVCDNETPATNTPNINPEEISNILEYFSSKYDFEWETFYDALQYINEMNSEKSDITESSPPAPPPISNNVSTPPIQASYPSPQPPPLVPPSTAYNPTPVLAPSRPKISINDPRIKKQLQNIKNSPIFAYNFLNRDLEESIRRICQSQELVSTPANSTKNDMVGTGFKASTGTSKSRITYGEYKRRQLEMKLELERKREEERKAKAREQLEREKQQLLEQSKNKENDIRSKLLSTLNPCKEQLTTLWSQQKNPATNEVNIATDIGISGTQNTKQPKGKKKQNSNKIKKADQKINKVYNELRCTVKGFDKIQDYIAEESAEIQSNIDSVQTAEYGAASRPIGLRRRSSMHALVAITEQLGFQSSDGSDSELSATKKMKRRAKDPSTESLSHNSEYSTSKRRKTIDEPIRPTSRSKALRIYDDEMSSISSDDEEIMNKIPIKKEVVIKLHRITDEFIRKHTKRLKKDTNTEAAVNDQSIRLTKTSEKIENLQEPSQKIPKLKKYNNDCQMTERNTHFCVLCRSKPSDLTNHYKGRHKTESYVSRLDWSELEDLSINTPFAILQPSLRFERYEVKCPFCNEKLIDQFNNLYNHYSTHTGEYAYQCSHCCLSKPYKPDIQSHILHSKTCRNSMVQILYRYLPQARCIYLYYCNICNFVQLNEANVLKHLREHHDHSKAIVTNVQKCILAAISDGPDAYEMKKSPSPTLAIVQQQKNSAVDADDEKFSAKDDQLTQHFPTNPTVLGAKIDFKVDDDDIPVTNEPCIDDEYFDEHNCSLENLLKRMDEQCVKRTEQPMTVIHCLGRDSLKTAPIQGSTVEQRHLPIIVKTDAVYEKDKLITTPSSCLNLKTKKETQLKQRIFTNHSVYEKYRIYPPNVNYLGLYKCMIGDCYYSTDCSDELVKHITEHAIDELQPNEYLQCAYCVISLDTPIQLANHVRTQHGHLSFQCSMCCYRSCDASNVYIHQQIHHNIASGTCKIYNCSTEDVDKNKRQNGLNKQIEKNVFRISCKFCNTSYYHTQLLLNHITREHKLTSINELKIYSCIYCRLAVDNKNQIRIHVAIKHPEELPIVYDHNGQISSINEDCISCSNVVNISEPVQWIETQSTKSSGIEENISQDIKPDLKELLRFKEETARVRLRKLTSHTGVAPDNLFRCPEETCGGFFSNYILWLKHMKLRHHTLECQCPHCPTAMLLTLEQFEMHFEQHRLHTFVCFYCSTTNPTELLASQHAAQLHSAFGRMRFEKIPFNLNYSYYIMIQSALYEQRENFINEFLVILDKRLKELESNEKKKLKHQWPVRNNAPWIEEYLQSLSTRKVARRCLVKDCRFRTLKEDILYRHLSTSHTITGTQFNCSKCDYHVEKCNNLDELFDHIKLHNEYHFKCGACSSLVTSSRPKMSAHIEEHHSARDVPVIHLFRTSEKMYFKIYIVFANNHITFSTMKNCFCCSEKNMSGDVFNLHLKRYHNLSLNYYCEKCNNFSFKSLKEVKPHFEQFHYLTNKFKIRCELAGHNDLHVESLDDFKIQILLQPQAVSQQTLSSLQVKDEPLEGSENDSVILIEEDDVEIQNFLKETNLKQAQAPKLKCTSLIKLLGTTEIQNCPKDALLKQTETPKLKCTALSKLLKPTEIKNSPNEDELEETQKPKIKCKLLSKLLEPTGNTLTMAGPHSYYNLNLQNTSTNPSTSKSLNIIPAASTQSNNKYLSCGAPAATTKPLPVAPATTSHGYYNFGLQNTNRNLSTSKSLIQIPEASAQTNPGYISCVTQSLPVVSATTPPAIISQGYYNLGLQNINSKASTSESFNQIPAPSAQTNSGYLSCVAPCLPLASATTQGYYNLDLQHINRDHSMNQISAAPTQTNKAYLGCVAPSLPVASFVTSKDYYNLCLQNAKSSINPSESLNQMPTTSAQTNSSYSIYDNTISNYNTVSAQSASVPLNINNQNSTSTTSQNLTNSFHTNQISNMQATSENSKFKEYMKGLLR